VICVYLSAVDAGFLLKQRMVLCSWQLYTVEQVGLQCDLSHTNDGDLRAGLAWVGMLDACS